MKTINSIVLKNLHIEIFFVEVNRLQFSWLIPVCDFRDSVSEDSQYGGPRLEYNRVVKDRLGIDKT